MKNITKLYHMGLLETASIIDPVYDYSDYVQDLTVHEITKAINEELISSLKLDAFDFDEFRAKLESGEIH